MITYSMASFIITAVAVVFSLACHEYGHGLASDLLGDPTPREAGRLTLNPLRHLDPLGTVTLLLFHFGWAKPVPIDPRYYKNRRFGETIVSLAGVGMNLLLAVLSQVLLVYFARSLPYLFGLFLQSMVIINCALITCNILPIPPLDGYHLWAVLLPDDLRYRIDAFVQKYHFGFFLLVLMGFQLFFHRVVNWVFLLVNALASIFGGGL